MAARKEITLVLPEGVDMEKMFEKFREMGIKTSTKNKGKEEYDNEMIDTYINAEVKTIIGHCYENGEYSFQVVWKGTRGETSWVKDSDCNCERTISAYLASRGINTSYMICRVSTPQQALDNTYSLASQAAALEKSDAHDGQRRRKVLRITGSAYKRMPWSIRNVFEAAHRGDTISVFRVDRLSRNIMELIPHLNACDEKGVDVFSVEDQLHYNQDRTRFLQMVLEAQAEADKMRKRQLQRIEYLRENKIASGRLKYGLKALNGRVVPDPDAQACIAFIKEHRRTLDNGDLAVQLNRNNMFYKGRPWSSKTVAYISKNNE